MNSYWFSVSLLPLLVARTQANLFGPTIAEVSPEWNNVLPVANFMRNNSVPFWGTTILSNGPNNTRVQTDLDRFRDASFVVYDQEMYKVLNVSDYQSPKQLEVLFTFDPVPSWALSHNHDGTVYAPNVNAIFFGEGNFPKPGLSAETLPYIWRIGLDNPSSPVVEKVYPNPPMSNPNGGYYHDGYVYWVQLGNATVPGGVVRMDPKTLETQVVNNNFYTHRYNSPNDIVVIDAGVVFFTDSFAQAEFFNNSLTPELSNNVYRWDTKTGNIKAVAGAGDGSFYNANGLAFNADQTKLFATSHGADLAGRGPRTIYTYDVTATGLANREVFAYVDAGIPDGIKTDRDGRLYAAVDGDVDVFNRDGTLLGRINMLPDDTPTNMAWVDNWLYITSQNHVYRVSLGTTSK